MQNLLEYRHKDYTLGIKIYNMTKEEEEKLIELIELLQKVQKGLLDRVKRLEDLLILNQKSSKN